MIILFVQPSFLFGFLTPFARMQPLEITLGNLSVIRHASPAFGVFMTVAACVNLVAVIRIVEPHLMTVFFDFFPVGYVCDWQYGHKTWLDAVSKPKPGEISGFQFDSLFRTAAERRLTTVVAGTVTINFPIREISSDGLKLADGVPFFLQSSVQGLFEDDEAMKGGIRTFPVDDLLHESFCLFHRVENAEIPFENIV